MADSEDILNSKEGTTTNNDQELPEEVREVVKRYGLELHAELQQLDSDYQARFVDSKWPENLEVLKEYCLERFNRHGQAMLPASVSSDATSINPLYAVLLDKAIEKTLEFLSTALQNLHPDMKADVISWVDLKLSSRKLYWLAHATREHLKSHPAPAIDLRNLTELQARRNPIAAAGGPEDPSLARTETTPEDSAGRMAEDTRGNLPSTGGEPLDVGQRRRGRPQKLSDENKTAAAKLKAAGGTNKQAAAVIYDTKRPTAQQAKNVTAILKHHLSKQSGSPVLPRKTSPKSRKSKG